MKTIKVLAGVVVVMLAMSVAARAEDDAMLLFAESYGAVQGLSLYNEQIVLGITADAYVHEVYDMDQTLEIILEQKNFIDLQKDYITKLLALQEVADEPKFFTDMLDCLDLLKRTAISLELFLHDPSEKNGNDFEEARQASYDAIAALLDLE